MIEENFYSSVSNRELADVQQRFITKVYGWMGAALVITGLVAMMVASSPTALATILGNNIVFFGLIIFELVLVYFLSARINKMSFSTAMLAFIIYSIVNGLTLSVIFVAFTQTSIATTFYITAATFGVMSVYGYVTKKDLTKFGNIAGMFIIGLVIAMIVNLFLQSPFMYWVISFVGVLLFTGLTAYDTQKIKQLSLIGEESSETKQKLAIMGALTLYLDFINLFLFLLRIFGSRD